VSSEQVDCNKTHTTPLANCSEAKKWKMRMIESIPYLLHFRRPAQPQDVLYPTLMHSNFFGDFPMNWLLKNKAHTLISFVAILFTIAILQPFAYADSVMLNPGASATFNYASTFGTAGQATATFSLSADGKTLTVGFLNTSTSDTFLSGIGFNTSPNLAITSAAFSGLPSGATWSYTSGGGGGIGNFEAGAYGNGNNNRLKPGEGGTLTLTLSSPQTNGITLDVTMTHLTSLPDGSSQKPVGVRVGGGTPPPPPAEVPEPATMLLLGSGLAALAGLRKRTQNKS
jgi:PEP-CTERM motif